MKYTAIVTAPGETRPLILTYEDGDVTGDEAAISIARDALRRRHMASAIPALPGLESPAGFAALCGFAFDRVISIKPPVTITPDDT